MSNPSVSSLKRPRSTSNPPSPSSTSSPKRAASEDPFTSSSDSGPPNDLLSPNTQITNASSPLRMDIDDDGNEQSGDGESGWVRRTEEVHLSPEGVGRGVGYKSLTEQHDELISESLRAQYDELLGEFASSHFSSKHPSPPPSDTFWD